VANILGPTETSPGWIPREVLGFYSDDFFFLIGVAITWTLVGRRLGGRVSIGVGIVKSVLLAGIGVLLFFLARHDFLFRLNSGPNISPFLALAWSISLVYLAVRGLVRLRQAGRQGLGERPDPCVRGI
jgi:hypothetical protein